MDSSNLFDYPDQEKQSTEELLFLKNQSKEDWEKLIQATTIRRFLSGEIIVEQGDMLQAFYIVVSGNLEVLMPIGKKQSFNRIAIINAGSIFGEQSFFDGKPRSATIRALTDGEIRTLTLEAFEVFAAHEPVLARAILFDLGRILSLRLRQTTASVALLQKASMTRLWS